MTDEEPTQETNQNGADLVAEQTPGEGDEELDPQARSLVVSGPIGFQGEDLPPDERRRVFDALYFEGDRQRPYILRFTVLIILSALIAALGLANDSAAVVIGAMLIAPLMTPMLGSAAAIVEGWTSRFIRAFMIVIYGALLAIAVGFIVAIVIPRLFPGGPLTGEILARTAPNLADLGIALAAGTAGAYIMVRSEASSALPGVGIAVALVPPLAVVGITAGVGADELAVGALLLFVTNLLAIVFAAGLTFAIVGFGGPRSVGVRLQGLAAAALFSVLLIAIGVPLALNAIETYGVSDRNRIAADVVLEWNPDVSIERLVVDPTVDPTRVTVELSGLASSNEPAMLATLLADRFEERIDLAMSFRPVYRGQSDN
jgi:uncharacterized hydrophobic protein (TIGR00271 family)